MKLPFDRDSVARKITDVLPEFSLPKLGREAVIPVYVIHASPDPEDYFFLFDFEVFVERSKEGMFVRPKLQLWAGRDDFSRTNFARQFRESFGREFDAMRAKLNNTGSGAGWLSWDIGLSTIGVAATGFVSLIVLLVSFGGLKLALKSLKMPSWAKGRSKEAKLEDQIDELKGQVELALSKVEVSVHPELYEHAFRDGGAGRRSTLERDAWPLPDYVRSHLKDGRSKSWW